MLQTKLAQKLNVSTRTLSRHKDIIEAKYGVSIATKEGRTLSYYPEFFHVLELSLKGQTLPKDLSVETPNESVIQTVDAELVEPETNISLATYRPSVERTYAPLAVQFVHNDLASLQAQTEANMRAASEAHSLLGEVIREDAANFGETIGAFIKEEISAAIAKAKREAVDMFTKP